MSWFSRDPGRLLTSGERGLAASIFGIAIDPDAVRLHRAKWFSFQPRNVAMAPDGGIWFHPQGGLWRADFATASEQMQALFVHELTKEREHQQTMFGSINQRPSLGRSSKVAGLVSTHLRPTSFGVNAASSRTRAPQVAHAAFVPHRCWK